MADFADIVGIDKIIRKAGLDPAENFEVIYDSLYQADLKSVLEELDTAIRNYFKELELSEEPSLYDYLVLSLTAKDLIVTFNWDPLLPQAFKRWRHLGVVLPKLAFLHGNVDVGIDTNKKVSGFLSDEPHRGCRLVPTRLLYPPRYARRTSPVSRGRI
jgi:hypothetical protein